MEVSTILDMIEKTEFAISTDETRYNLNGVFFDPGAETTRMVATDGHRLCLIEKPFVGKFDC